MDRKAVPQPPMMEFIFLKWGLAILHWLALKPEAQDSFLPQPLGYLGTVAHATAPGSDWTPHE